MSPQRVCILGSELLLTASVANLLSRDEGLEIVHISSSDKAALITEVDHHRPDVVVVDEATYLADSCSLLCLLGEHTALRLVVVSADDNHVRIYRTQQVLLTQGTDLFHIIRNDHGSSSKKKGGSPLAQD